MSLTIHALIKAKEGKEERIRQALLAMLEPTRAEAGCEAYILHRSKEDSTAFLFYETWASQEAFQAHLETPHFKNLVATAEKDGLFAEPPQITQWEKIG